tara:strand:- start:1589 stop:1762 length:174 start_codon:yes stop_codon:yes gene_type:complete
MAKLKRKHKVNSVNQQVAGNYFGVPSNVRDAAKRQYSGKGYTTKDKQTIINYYKTKA